MDEYDAGYQIFKQKEIVENVMKDDDEEEEDEAFRMK